MKGNFGLMTPDRLANLIRLAGDDEITAEQQAVLDGYLASHPEARLSIQFERDLRASVGRVLGGVKAPELLRSSVAVAMSTAAVNADEDRQSRMRFVPLLGSGPLPSALAAAIVLLIGTAVVVGIFGLPGQTQSVSPGPSVPVRHELNFPAQEHVRCALDDLYAREKLTLQTVEEVLAHFQDELDWMIEVPDLSSAGFNFLDAGPCTASGRNVESVHLRYGNDESLLSVWVDRAPRSDLTHLADFDEGHAYLVIPTNGLREPDKTNSYYAWRVGEFVYRLVPSTVLNARKTAMALGMPDVPFEEFK